MHQTSTPESVCDERAAASRALLADPADLFISPSTAKSHVLSILGKLRRETRIQAAVCAARCDLV
jgi:hypothetical protein